MPEPLVSVIIPTYNRAYCICRTIDSVLAQTYRAIEVVIVDDGSTDATADVIRAHYGQDPRIRYHYRRNGGVSAARNTGMSVARGEYIALLDSDDLWEPWKLELQIAAFRQRPELGMIWTDMAAIDSSGATISEAYLREMYTAHKWFPTSELFAWSRCVGEFAPTIPDRFHQARFYAGDVYSAMVTGNLAHTSTVMLTRDRMQRAGQFRIEYSQQGEDYEYFLRVCREGPVGLIDLPTIIYQKGRADQITTNCGIGIARNFVETLNRTLARDRHRINLSPRMLNLVLADAHCWLGVELIKGEQYRAARSHLIQGLRRKFDAPAFRQLILTFLPGTLRTPLVSCFRTLRRSVAQTAWFILAAGVELDTLCFDVDAWL
jgi:glycosyltransferase involved in cell wall biosynthesis